MHSSAILNVKSVPGSPDCARRKLGPADLRCVFVDDSSGAYVVVSRSFSDELEVELAKGVSVACDGRLGHRWRLLHFGIRQGDEGLYLSIRGEGAIFDERDESVHAGVRILVPDNVRLEFVSHGDLAICRDFPPILVLRDCGGNSCRSSPLTP